MSLFFGKKYAVRDIPASTRGYIKAELEWIEKAHEEQRCSGYLYAKAVAGKKALTSEKLSKKDIRTLYEIVLAMREMMEETEGEERTAEEFAAYTRLMRNNTDARNILKGMLG